MKRFVIIIPNADPNLQEKVTNYFKANAAAWWHWSADCWLIVTLDGATQTPELRGLIHGLAGAQIQLLVLSVRPEFPDPWSGFGPQNWEDWLETAWVADNFAPLKSDGRFDVPQISS